MHTIIPISHMSGEHETTANRKGKEMKSVVLNIGTKRNNKVSDSVTAIGLDDIDHKIRKLSDFFGGSDVLSCKLLPVESDWGRDWTIVLKIGIPESASTVFHGEDYADLSCILFEQEAVAFKEYDCDTVCDCGLVYHVNWHVPKHGRKYSFDNAYFVDA